MRDVLDFNQDWRFSRDVAFDAAVSWTPAERDLLGFEPTAGDWDGVTWSKAGKCYGPASPDFDDAAWRTVTLPHDWCVEHRPDPGAPIRNGFLPMGVGWYRKVFEAPESWEGRRVFLCFDGVFRNATVFVNGHLVARNESGYIGFDAGIDALLNVGGTNTVTVRVDARTKEGWFYEGCGIYRPVRLVVADPLRIEQDGVFVSADLINGDRPPMALVEVSTEVVNDGDDSADLAVIQRIITPDGVQVAEVRQDTELKAGRRATVRQSIEVSNPQRWSLGEPRLYELATTLVHRDAAVDEVSQPFGLRTAHFDGAKGFFLNGEAVKLKGVCCHQDHAGVGMAIPSGLQVWRLEQLKAMGVNAYRCAHNPPAREVLEACDRLGIVVIDELRAFGVGEEHIGQAERMVRRDRNHPCVIAWSLGNEEMHVQCSPAGARMFAQLKRRLRVLDDTRPFTAAINNGWDTAVGFIEHEDVHGLNYLNQGDLDTLRDIAPDMPVILSEAASAVSTRGVYEDDPALGTVTCYDTHTKPDHPGVRMWPFWGRAAEASWKVVAARPDLAGTFVWTGFDYRGEQSPYVRWPCVGSHFGIMDQCGFPKDVYWYYKAWWSHEPVLHMFPHWDWPEKEGEPVEVWAYSNADEVALTLNGRDLGSRPVPTNGHVSWTVKYEPGELCAVGRWRDGSTSEAVRKTTGPAHAVRLTPVSPRLGLYEDGTRIVNVSVCDADGQTVPHAMHPLRFEVRGDAALIGLGNGDPNDHTPGRPLGNVAVLSAFNGLAQAVLRVGAGAGRRPVELEVSSPGLQTARQTWPFECSETSRVEDRATLP